MQTYLADLPVHSHCFPPDLKGMSLAEVKNTWQKEKISIIVIFSLLFLLTHIIRDYYNTGWKYAAATTYGMTLVFAGWAFLKDITLVKKVLLFGVVAGILELAIDWYVVDVVKVLVYAPGEPMILSSPLYMPLSWALMFLYIGYFSLILTEIKGLWLGIVGATVGGMLFIPAFEYWAAKAGWWYYHSCKMIGPVPWFIICCEALVSFIMPVVMLQLNKRGYGFAVIAGTLQGIWLFVSSFISFHLIGR